MCYEQKIQYKDMVWSDWADKFLTVFLKIGNDNALTALRVMYLIKVLLLDLTFCSSQEICIYC